MENWINLIPIIITAVALSFLMVTDSWKKSLIAQGLVYVCAFLILVQYWTFMYSLVKLITGLMSLVILGISVFRANPIDLRKTTSEKIFRLVALFLSFLIVAFIIQRFSTYLSIPLEMTLAALMILVCGVLRLGMTQIAHKVFQSILLLFFGFEIIYSSNESSLLVTGLLAAVSLLVSLIGAYIITTEYEIKPLEEEL